MKKKVTTVAAIALSFACAAGGCGAEKKDNKKNETSATKIVIYAGGSSEFAWVEGSEETEVIEAVENAYYEDTGTKLDFEITFKGSSDFSSAVSNALTGGDQLDIAISHTRGGAGIDDTALSNNWFYDLTEDLEDYGENVLAKIAGDPIDSLTTVRNEIIGFPSVISPYKFGILVRKDWMEACGYTDDAKKAKNGDFILVNNLEAFENMCVAMKAKYNLNHVITGAPWDLEKVLTLGAYGDSGYFTYTTRGEGDALQVMPGFVTDEYAKVLKEEYDWAREGIVSNEAEMIKLETGETNFIAGKTGVFVLDPTVQHLIKVARKTKAQHSEAEFTVLGALTETAETTKKGFMKNTPATFAACVMKTSQNSAEIVKFMNWVYESEDNYNLCRYGVEGVHWINNCDGTYSYPAGKEIYATEPAYSGILTLVENQNVSNLTYKGYSEEEKQWIATAADPSNYIENDIINYLFPVPPAAINNDYTQQKQTLYGRVGEAWRGAVDPSLHYATVNVTDYLKGGGQKYQDYLTQQYKIMKTQRDKKGKN